MENCKNVPKTAEQRKKKTEKLLKSLDIPYLEHLPPIEEESEVKIRTAQEIAERILILTYLSYLGFASREGIAGDEREKIVNFIKTNLLWDKVSPEEKELYQKEQLTQQEILNMTWRLEAIWLLLWTINKVDKLELPTRQVEPPEIMSKMPKLFDNPKEFIETAIIRPTTEILYISDLTYRLHWAATDAELNNQPMPANLDSGIIYERHYAINWVTYYAEEWDEVTTDT